jgi:hypothetical protein
MGAQPRLSNPGRTPGVHGCTRYHHCQISGSHILSGLLWGITSNPQAYDKVYWHLKLAKSRLFDPKTPRFTMFNIESEGTPEEYVLLCWIEEAKTADEVTEYLM